MNSVLAKLYRQRQQHRASKPGLSGAQQSGSALLSTFDRSGAPFSLDNHVVQAGHAAPGDPFDRHGAPFALELSLDLALAKTCRSQQRAEDAVAAAPRTSAPMRPAVRMHAGGTPSFRKELSNAVPQMSTCMLPGDGIHSLFAHQQWSLPLRAGRRIIDHEKSEGETKRGSGSGWGGSVPTDPVEWSPAPPSRAGNVCAPLGDRPMLRRVAGSAAAAAVAAAMRSTGQKASSTPQAVVDAYGAALRSCLKDSKTKRHGPVGRAETPGAVAAALLAELQGSVRCGDVPKRLFVLAIEICHGCRDPVAARRVLQAMRSAGRAAGTEVVARALSAAEEAEEARFETGRARLAAAVVGIVADHEVAAAMILDVARAAKAATAEAATAEAAAAEAATAEAATAEAATAEAATAEAATVAAAELAVAGRRIDDADGLAYTADDFFVEYGNLDKWHVAAVAPGSGDSEAADKERRIDDANGRAYTKEEFRAHYGNLKHWRNMHRPFDPAAASTIAQAMAQVARPRTASADGFTRETVRLTPRAAAPATPPLVSPLASPQRTQALGGSNKGHRRRSADWECASCGALVVAARAHGACFRCGATGQAASRAAEGGGGAVLGEEVVYAAACRALGGLGRWEEAVALVEVNMAARGVRPSSRTLALALRACASPRGDRPKDSAEAALRLIHATQLPRWTSVPRPADHEHNESDSAPKPRPSSLAYSSLVRSLGRAGRFVDALTALEAMETSHAKAPHTQPRPTGETYGCALAACASAARLAVKAKPIEAVEGPRAQRSWGDAALAVLKRVAEPNEKHFTAAMGALASEGRRREVLELFLAMQADHNLTPDRLVFAQLNLVSPSAVSPSAVLLARRAHHGLVVTYPLCPPLFLRPWPKPRWWAARRACYE